MSLATTLFPPANRQTAFVAFLRTFWQVIKGTSVVGATGYVTVTAGQLVVLDVHTVLLVVGALVVSALLSGAFAASNILINGLPATYVAAVVATVPAVVPEAVAVPVEVAPVVTPAA